MKTTTPPIGHNNPPKPKRARLKRGDRNYVNNKEFTAELDKYGRECRAAIAAGEKRPVMSRYLGECVIKMSNRLASTPRFYGYTYKDEMIQNGILGAMKYMHRFDGDRFDNGFAYVTQILFSHMIVTIKNEKKKYETNLKLIQNAEASVIGNSEFTEVANDHARAIADQKLGDLESGKMKNGQKGGFQLRTGYTKASRDAYNKGTPMNPEDRR